MASQEPDEQFAEWFVWAKREVSPDSRVCLGAAQAAMEALEAGADVQTARTTARRSIAGQGVVLAPHVTPRRRAYAEWYDWARLEVRGDPEKLHSAAHAALDRLEQGGTSDDAARAARAAVGEPEAAAPPPPPAAAGSHPWVPPPTPSPAAGGPPPPPPMAAAGGLTPPPPLAPGAPFAPQVSAPTHAYAGFWRRLAAYLIDFVLLIIGLVVILLVIGIFVGIALLSTGQDNTTNAGLSVAIYLIAIVLSWVYFAGLESSGWQATVGKRAMNLVVTDVYGRRISFGRATGRYFAKILSGLTLLIGYLMIAFTPRKQGLHDMIAGTLVVRRQYLSLLTTSPEQMTRQGQPASAQSL